MNLLATAGEPVIVVAPNVVAPNVAHHSVNFIPFCQKQLSQVRTVLPCYSCDQSSHADAHLSGESICFYAKLSVHVMIYRESRLCRFVPGKISSSGDRLSATSL